jgi:GNAT superfamily N-acetyltransferase
MTSINIRKGTAQDLQAAFNLILELAVYEKAPHEVTNSPEKMLADGFGEKPVFEFFVAQEEDQIVGIALYYVRYSTWKGRCIYLEDIIITEKCRGKGIGKVLFEAVMQETLRQDAALLVWQVLDWNEPALNFYRKFEASFDAEWLNGKLTKEQIKDMKLGGE